MEKVQGPFPSTGQSGHGRATSVHAHMDNGTSQGWSLLNPFFMVTLEAAAGRNVVGEEGYLKVWGKPMED